MPLYLKEPFRAYYHDVVRPLAEKCARDFNVIGKTDSAYTKEDEKILKQYKDYMAVYFIGTMIGVIDRALLHGQGLDMLNSVNQIHGTLMKGSTYWANVWKNDFSSPEAQDLQALGNAMEELVRKL